MKKKKLSKIMLKNTPVLKLFFESFTSWADSNSDGQGMLRNKQRQLSWTEEKQSWPLL